MPSCRRPPAGVAQQARDVLGQLLGTTTRVRRSACRVPVRHRPGPVALAHRLPEHRQRLARHVELRIQAVAHALERDQGLDQQGHVGGQAQPVLAQQGGHLGQHAPEIDLAQRGAVVLVDERVDLALERAEVQVVIVAGPVEQHLGHGPGAGARPGPAAAAAARRAGGA